MNSGLPPVLTASLAQEIAGDTSAIIGLNILITDTEGTVIGSGDLRRVGSFHEASVQVMRSLQPAAHTAAQARQLRGVRPGVTLPILLDNLPVGTVGITGPPSRVRRFGLVVQRQTEILLQESLLLRSRLLRERALEDLLRDVAYFDAEVLEPDFVTSRASEMGYDLGLARAAVLIDVSEAVGPDSQQAVLLRAVREHFADSQDIVAAIGAGRVVALHRVAAARLPPDDAMALRGRCDNVVTELGQRYGIRARVGIGDATTSVSGLRESYEDAAAALTLGARLDPTARVHTIEDLRLHQVLAAVGHRARTRFVDMVAKPLPDQKDWPILRQTVVSWCESGFNLVRAAAALHIHRNTLVYRLDKIARLTGRPTGDQRATLALYIACLADRLEH